MNVEKCPLGTFQDVTESLLSQGSSSSSAYWYRWRHSGKPFTHYTSPVMVDLNGDLILDYFTSLHGANMQGGTNKMELALMEKNQLVNGSYYLMPLENGIILEDNATEGYMFMDNHCDVVADLDNDGILDIYVASGGGSGLPLNNIQSRDNFVFYGEEVMGNNEEEKSRIVFKGGRQRALASNIHMRMGRGRFTYLLDVNGDGLLDMFHSNVRRVDNSLAPGVLHINEGNRTWRIDESMSEFSSTMILTDADGDGIAEEFLVTRDFCFPNRDDPDSHPRFGPFPQDVNAFCSTRPVGTTAVYKFNRTSNSMEDISQTYVNIQAAASFQPECCPHGLRSGQFECSAVSLASGDFDHDGKADLVVLYNRKMQFYFSSDRPKGTLPIGNQYIGLTIDLPPSCYAGESIRLLDLDNSGVMDIMVLCQNVATILIYTQGDAKDSWTLNNGCNSNGTLGDFAFSAFEWRISDILDACKKRDSWKKLGPICDQYTLDGTKEVPISQGMTLADMNNDGFTDAIITTNMGYQRFFLNKPSPKSRRNKHVSFRLIGDGKEVNKYGIGATLKLQSNIGSTENNVQFREISSYQHSTDKSGSIDEKIIFGLGTDMKPIRLIVTWPNGRRQVLNLRRFDFSSSFDIIDVRYPPKSDTNKIIKVQIKKVSKAGQKLCLSVGLGVEWRMVQVEECGPSSRQNFWFDNMGRLRNEAYPDHCVTANHSKNNIRMLECKNKKAKKRSWHLTPSGSYLRESGSNMVIGTLSSNVTVGDIMALVEFDRSMEDQKMVLLQL